MSNAKNYLDMVQSCCVRLVDGLPKRAVLALSVLGEYELEQLERMDHDMLLASYRLLYLRALIRGHLESLHASDSGQHDWVTGPESLPARGAET